MQNIDCGHSLEPPRRGGSNEYPQYMFLSKNKKITYTPINPSFTVKKWGLRGSKLYRHVFVMSAEISPRYEGPVKRFVTGFGLLQCYVLSNIFLLQTFKVFPLY